MTPIEPPLVDWDQVKRCLAALHREAQPFLSRALLIGGAACWFYRNALRGAADPDFKVPALSPALEAKWLSKDLDFTGIFSRDAMELMPARIVRGPDQRAYLAIEGIRLGFAQAGLTIDPEEARRLCRVGRFTTGEGETVEFFVADPVTLYREKLALTQRRNSPADPLHLALLAEYLRWETAQQAAKLCASPSLAETKSALNFLQLVRDRAAEVLRDGRLARRLEISLAGSGPEINPPDAQFLRSLLADTTLS